MPPWINFKALREEIKFAYVLHHFQVEVKAGKTQHQGPCPLPQHGNRNKSACFSANLEKGIFQCFGCKAKGNVLDFAVLMACGNPDNGEDVRKAALLLQQQFKGPSKGKSFHKAEQKELPGTELKKDKKNLEVRVNAPLDFELKNLDESHPYLERLGFTLRTIKHFGVGFCKKGLLTGRIAIPLHSMQGDLIGYAGRLPERADGDQEKYKFPSEREHKEVRYAFNKELVVYNANRIEKPVNDLAVVSDFESAWWLWQMGIPQVVALVETECSREQANILTQLVPESGSLWIISDGSNAGAGFATAVFRQLSPLRFTRWLTLDEGKHPTDFPGAYYRERLGK
jgi:DNA primase